MKRNKMSLSNYQLTTFDMGELIPIGWYEALPGDTIQQATSALLRCTPLVTPIMHPVHVRIHHWFVPNRIIWDSWEDFITGGQDGLDTTVPPTISTGGTGINVGSLADYMGVPPSVANLAVSALPFRAYAMIYNEFYRDADLTPAVGLGLGNGNDTTTNTVLRNVSWEKDYFTSARPWAQKGPSVTIPLGTTAPVKTGAQQISGTQSPVIFRQSVGGALPPSPRIAMLNTDGSLNTTPGAGAIETGGFYPSNLYTDLSGASAVTVGVLREALALQRYEEARARFGSRYVEYLRYLGVKSSDARLQRPEYLGGGKQTIQFSEVLSTADGGASLPIGSLKGHGIGAMRSNRFRRFFEEHGIVMTLMSVRPRTMYTQGIARKFNRTTRDDYWQKEFEHIGQQTIENKEVYAAHASPTGTFGWQDRYDEYRRQESSVSGLMRTTDNMWHMARIFGSSPALNASFVASDPTKRTFANTTDDGLIVMANHSIQARRQLSQTGSSFIY